MRKLFIFLFASCCGSLISFGAIDLKESKFTQVVNDVQVVSTVDNSKKPAAIDDLFKIPDVLRTGPASRAELVAEDRTITRVGANTIFSFDQARRSIHLEKGSLLFNSPKGKGGGSIRTAAATAAVLGTTLIVTTTPDGGFKVLTLEGHADVSFENGKRQRLDSGQMTFVLPGSIPGPVIMFRLDQQLAGSTLMKGFTKPLPGQPRIDAAVAKQLREIKSGRVEDTGLKVGDKATAEGVQVIALFDQVSASSTNGSIPGLTSAVDTKNKLPDGFEVPPRLVFSEDQGGFQAREGNSLLFVSSPARGTNPAVNIELAAGPADAALDAQTINTPFTANDPRVFRNSVDIFSTEPSEQLYSSFKGFIGQSITINTPSLDLNQFAPMDHFDFLSLQDLTIAGNLNISASQIPGGVILTAGTDHRISIASGTTLNVDSPILSLVSLGGFTLDSATVRNQNTAGFLALSAPSVALNNSFLAAGEIRVASGGPLSATATSPAAGGINGSSGVTLSSGSGMTIGVDVGSNPNSGTIDLGASSGILTVNNGATVQAGSVQIRSPGGVALNNTTVTGNQLTVTDGSFSGESLVDVRNSRLTLNGSVVVANTEGAITISDSQISAGSLFATSGNETVLNKNTLTAANQLNLTGGEAVSLTDTAVHGDSVRITAGTGFTASRTTAAQGDIRGDSSVVLNSDSGLSLGVNVASGTTPASGSISLVNGSGELSVTPGVNLTAGAVSLSSGAGILVEGATISGGQMSLNTASSVGGGTASLRNSTFTLTGPLTVDSRAGIGFDTATVSGRDVNLAAGELAADPDSDPILPGAGPISLARSTFDLTGSMTIRNDTGILAVDSNSRITAAGAVTVTSPDGLVLNTATVSGSQIALASGNEAGTAAVSLQSSSLTASSGLNVTGDTVDFNNATLTATSDLRVQGGTVGLNNTILAGETVTVTSAGFISAPNVAPNNGRITGNSAVTLTAQSGGMTLGVDVSANAASGTINLVNNGGVLNANGGKTFQAAFVNVSSPGGLLFDNTRLNSSRQVNFTVGSQPGTLAVVQNTAFTGAADVNIAGHTVVLNQVDFAAGSAVSLRSLLGQLAANPNSGQQVQGGYVNYIQNVNYGGAPAQNFTGPGQPITISTLP